MLKYAKRKKDTVLEGLIAFCTKVCLPLIIMGLVFDYLTNNHMFLIVSIIVMLFPSSIFIGLYLYFAMKDPDRLQTENFLLERQKLEKLKESFASRVVKPFDESKWQRK
jgi:undecaprenyl pyrophosphate phosphatase UppP